MCADLGVERLPGLHCYDVYAGPDRLARFFEEQPGTYVFTDFLVRSFARTVRARARPGPLARAARRLLQELHPRRLAGPGAGRRAARPAPSEAAGDPRPPATVVDTGTPASSARWPTWCALTDAEPPGRPSSDDDQPDPAEHLALDELDDSSMTRTAAMRPMTTVAVPVLRGTRSERCFSAREPAIEVLAPGLGLGDLVERVEVQALHRASGSPRVGAHWPRKRSPVKPPGATRRVISPFCLDRKRVESPTPILVAMPISLVRSTGPGQPEQQRQVMPRSRSRCSQSLTSAGSKVRLRDDVRGVLALVPHRLDGQVVVDRRVRLGVARDADVLEGPPQGGEVLQQRERVGVVAGRRRVAAGHEHPADPRLAEPGHDLLELAATGDHPGGEVRDDDVPRRGEAFGQGEGVARAPWTARRSR